MDWVKDDGGLLRRVSPFRYLRIVGYLLLPEAFRSLSRLSSALSAKASTICSFLHDQLPDGSTHSDGMSLCALRLPAHRHSVAGVGSRPIFSVRFLRTSWLMFFTLPRMSWYFYLVFLYAVFKVHGDWILSVIKNQKLFWSLITGKTSYYNSTALLIGLALISCCSSLPVSIAEDFIHIIVCPSVHTSEYNTSFRNL